MDGNLEIMGVLGISTTLPGESRQQMTKLFNSVVGYSNTIRKSLAVLDVRHVKIYDW